MTKKVRLIKNAPSRRRSRIFLLFTISLILGGVFFLVKGSLIQACRDKPVCDFPCGDAYCYPSPTPTEIPSPTPTEIPETTPTPTEAASPTPTFSQEPTPTQVAPTPTTARGFELGGPPICNALAPNAPKLVSVTVLPDNKVKLVWEPVENATDYTISYGPESGNYPWGVFKTGNRTDYSIEGLSAGCFVVKAVNDCAPGVYSNEVCSQGRVLGLSFTGSRKKTNPVAFWLGVIILIPSLKYLTGQLILLNGKKKRN